MLIGHASMSSPYYRRAIQQRLSKTENESSNGSKFYWEFSESWKHIENADGTVFLHAPKYVELQLIDARESLCSADWLSYLHTVDGPYVVVRIVGNSVEISRSLYRGLDVFYTRIANHLAFSTSLSRLLQLKRGNSQSLDREYCRRFVLDRPTFSGATAISEVQSIPLGQSIRSDLEAISTIRVQMPCQQSKGPIETLTKKMSTLSRSFSAVSLSFSGGLDSSALLHCLNRAEVVFEAIHAVSPLPYADTERLQAEKVAAAYDQEISIVEMIESEALAFTPSMLKELAYGSPFDVNIFRSSRGEVPKQDAFPDSCVNHLMVTGHGGDHVFLQNPSWNVGFDRIQKKDIRGFFADVKRCCTLKKTNFYAGLLHNMRLLFDRRGSSRGLYAPKWLRGGATSLGMDDHYLLAGLDPRSAKFDHVRSILLGLSTIEMYGPGNRAVLHPLLLPDVIGTVLYRPVGELFSAQHDRLYFRRDFYDSAGHDVAWRRSKRSSSASLFKYFNDNQEVLFEWLADGIVARCLGLDAGELKKSLAMNGQVYLDPDFPALVNLIQLEGFVQSVQHHSQ